MRHDADTYAGFLVSQGLADNTIRNYRCLYQRWLDWCATNDADPDALNPGDLRTWSRTLPPSRSTMGQARAVINYHAQMLDVAAPDGAIPLPRAPRQSCRALTDDDAHDLEDAAHYAGEAGTAVLIGLYTAARRSEIAGMRWEHVHATRITWWRPKVSDWHTVPLHPVLAQHLERRRIEEVEWLFPGRWGGHVSPAQVGKWTDQVSAQAGIGHVTPHQLRATALTNINDATGDLRATADFAGHTKMQTTMAYTRVAEDRLARVVSMLDYGRGVELGDTA